VDAVSEAVVSPSREKILNFMIEFRERDGHWPTVREIMTYMNFSSPNGIICHLKPLMKRGFIGHGEHCSGRAWHVLKRPDGSEYFTPVRDDIPTRRDTLTYRQREVLEFILKYQKDYENPPTIREIGNHFRMSNTNAVMCHIRALVKKGFLSKGNNQSRSLNVIAIPS
jgi:SOS-response transcriptional repressor LexA